MKKNFLLIALLGIVLTGCENMPSSTDRTGIAEPNPALEGISGAAADKNLTQTIQRVLKEAPAFKDIKVSINEGRVTLTGTVPTESDKAKAADLVQKVNGVISIDNRIEVSK